MLDSTGQGSAIETGSVSRTYVDHSTSTALDTQRVKADSLIRSKANACIPQATGKPYQALLEDIRKNGQLNPVLVHGDEVVDGWTRVRICIELGRPVLTLQVANADDKKPEDWVRATLSSQFSRQHFSKLQKAAIIREMVQVVGRGRPKKGSKIDSFLDELAKEYQISKSYFKLVDRVQREWVDALEDIRLGKITASQVNAHFKETSPDKASKSAASVGKRSTRQAAKDDVAKSLTNVFPYVSSENQPTFNALVKSMYDLLAINPN